MGVGAGLGVVLPEEVVAAAFADGFGDNRPVNGIHGKEEGHDAVAAVILGKGDGIGAVGGQRHAVPLIAFALTDAVFTCCCCDFR